MVTSFLIMILSLYIDVTNSNINIREREENICEQKNRPCYRVGCFTAPLFYSRTGESAILNFRTFLNQNTRSSYVSITLEFYKLDLHLENGTMMVKWKSVCGQGLDRWQKRKILAQQQHTISITTIRSLPSGFYHVRMYYSMPEKYKRYLCAQTFLLRCSMSNILKVFRFLAIQ